MHLKTEAFTRETLQQRFPQFDADMGRLDVEAGFLYAPVITQTLLGLLKERHVNIGEEVEVTHIEQRDHRLHIISSAGGFGIAKIGVTAGLGTNEGMYRVAAVTF